MRRAVAVLLGGLSLFGLTGSAGAIAPPSGFIDTTAVSGLSSPTSMVWDPSSARLFVTQQGGDLRVVKDGKLLSTPFLHLSVDSNGERGLLGVELDPNFASNHFLYVYYTVPGSPPHNRVSRFTANGDVAQSGSEQVLLNLNNLSSATNHNGGSLHFGADGKLYVGVGENANGSNSQTLTNLLGKLLRMNSDGSIPGDNPFVGTATGQNQLIYALGLRNPFTFAFQPGTGRLFINDVGQSTWEEINEGVAGANYGWPDEEGPASPPDPTYTDPLFFYGHGSTSTTGCAITGGTFYNPPVAYFPSQYVGRYFFSDLCSGWIRQLDPSNGNAVTDFATGADTPVDLDTGPDGSLYYLEHGTRVGRISFRSTPTVSAFGPSSGPAGQRVVIDGTYLAGATSLRFNGTPATFSVVWDTKLVATVPAGATSGPIEVTTGDGTADSAGNFTVTSPPAPPPTITSFSPTSGSAGTSVKIKGTNFTTATGVSFHGTPAQSFTINSDSKLFAVVAAGTTSGTITVTGPGGTATSPGSFTVGGGGGGGGVTIASFSPTSGKVGTKITIKGSGFKNTKSVSINGTKTSFSVKSDTSISATVQKGTTSGPIKVTGPNGTAVSAGVFTVT